MEGDDVVMCKVAVVNLNVVAVVLMVVSGVVTLTFLTISPLQHSR